MNINDVLKNFNENELRKVNDFLNSAQGKKTVSDISEKDKSDILNRFMNLDPQLVKNKLNGLSKEDILKLLK